MEIYLNHTRPHDYQMRPFLQETEAEKLMARSADSAAASLAALSSRTTGFSSHCAVCLGCFWMGWFLKMCKYFVIRSVIGLICLIHIGPHFTFPKCVIWKTSFSLPLVPHPSISIPWTCLTPHLSFKESSLSTNSIINYSEFIRNYRVSY